MSTGLKSLELIMTRRRHRSNGREVFAADQEMPPTANCKADRLSEKKMLKRDCTNSEDHTSQSNPREDIELIMTTEIQIVCSCLEHISFILQSPVGHHHVFIQELTG